MVYGQYCRLSWAQKVLVLNKWNRRNEPIKELTLSAFCEWAAVKFNQNLCLSTKSLRRIIRSSNHIQTMAEKHDFNRKNVRTVSNPSLDSILSQ